MGFMTTFSRLPVENNCLIFLSYISNRVKNSLCYTWSYLAIELVTLLCYCNCKNSVPDTFEQNQVILCAVK